MSAIKEKEKQMAIQQNISKETSQYGIAFNDAYYRIVTAQISRPRVDEVASKFMVMIDLSAYATNSPTDNTKEVDFKRYHVGLAEIEAKSGDDFLSKCYAWVMAQSDMSGSSAV